MAICLLGCASAWAQSYPPFLMYTLIGGVPTPVSGSGAVLPGGNPPGYLCYGLNGSGQPAPCVFGGIGVTSINTVAGAFTFNGPAVSCTSTTCTFTGTGTGIGSIAWAIPSWLTASPTTISASGTQTFSPTTGQTSHEVIGTCGAATTFGPCALVAGDLPAVTNIAGGAANEIVYQTATSTTGFIAAAASCVLSTNGSNVPSCSTTLPSGLSSTSMTLVTPALGTPASGVITNLSGTCASCNIGGNAGTATDLSTTGSNGTFWGVSGGVQGYYTPGGGGNVSTSGTITTGQYPVWASGTTLNSQPFQYISVKRDYAATGNTQVDTTCTVTASSTTLTCSDGPFVSGDVGKTIGIPYAGPVGAFYSIGETLVTTIASYSSATTVVLTAAPSVSISGPFSNTGCSASAYSKSLTCSSSTFTQGDVGKSFTTPTGNAGANNSTSVTSQTEYATNAGGTVITGNRYYTSAVSGQSVSIPGATVIWGTDDTTALSNAFTAGCSSGRPVNLDPGRYLMSSGFLVCSGLYIIGSGAGVSILNPVGSSFSPLYNHNTAGTSNEGYISFEIDARGVRDNTFDVYSKGLDITNLTNAWVENLYVHDTEATGLATDYPHNVFKFANRVVHAGAQYVELFGAIGSACSGDATGFNDTESEYIGFNDFSDCGNRGVFIETQGSSYSKGFRIEGNTCEWLDTGEGVCYGDHGGDQAIWQGNLGRYSKLCFDVTGGLNGTSYPLNWDFDGNACEYNDQGAAINYGDTTLGAGSVTNNKFLGSLSLTTGSMLGFTVNNGSSTASLEVSGNFLDDYTGNGISFGGSNSFGSVNLSSNHIANMGVSTGSLNPGIVVTQSIGKLSMTGNTAYDTRGGSAQQSYGFSQTAGTITELDDNANQFTGNATGARNLAGTITTYDVNGIAVPASTQCLHINSSGVTSTTGSDCGSGSSGLSGMTATQVPIAATATTVTSSKALAGSGTGITTGPITTTSGDCVEFSGTAGQIADNGSPCGSGSGAVTSVTNSDGTLTISPTTGAVVASLALAHANTWTGNQTSAKWIASTGFDISGATTAGHYLRNNGTDYVDSTIQSGDLPAIALSGLATQTANTVVGNGTSGSASPTALTMPSCSGASNALTWTTSGGSTAFGCNTISGGGTPAYPLTITGGVSGGVVYGSSSTQLTVSPAGTANVLMKWGGAATAPGNSSITDNATSVTTTDTGGWVGPTFTANGTTAGFMDYAQGSTSASVAPCNTATSICEQAPTSVTSYLLVKPGVAAAGVKSGRLASSVVTEGISGDTNHSATVVIGSGTSIGSTSLCSTTVCPAGTYRINVYVDITTACGTTGTYTVNLIYTDDQGSKTSVVNLNGTGSVPATGLLTTTSTSNFGQESQIIRSTGAASINYSTTAVACGTGGPMVGNLYLSTEQVQ